MVHDVALVLGGGGAAGQAWQVGVIAGLAEGGVDLAAAADLVIGTSAGSTTAAWVRSGIPAGELFALVMAEPGRAGGPRAEPGQATTPGQAGATGQAGGGRLAEMSAAGSMETVFARMRAIGAAARSAAELRRAMGAFGLASDSRLGAAASERRRAVVAARLPRHEWPERAMVVVAVDAHTGELAAFDRESGVSLVDAVTASTALPGGLPTHLINGRRYINGGVRSAENADLASGYATVVVLSPFGDWDRTPQPEGQFEGLRRDPAWGTDLASEVAALRRQGSRVEVVTPDGESRAAMGTNQMDPATRVPSARAGFAQGVREATRVALP